MYRAHISFVTNLSWYSSTEAVRPKFTLKSNKQEVDENEILPTLFWLLRILATVAGAKKRRYRRKHKVIDLSLSVTFWTLVQKLFCDRASGVTDRLDPSGLNLEVWLDKSGYLWLVCFLVHTIFLLKDSRSSKVIRVHLVSCGLNLNAKRFPFHFLKIIYKLFTFKLS